MLTDTSNEIYLQIDSRQQANKHELKDKYFEEHNIKTLKSKLPFGDYAIINKMNVVVDTKKDAMELFGDLTKQHTRFRKEIQGANDFNIGLVILIEEEDYYADLDTFKNWYRVPRWKSDGWKTVNGKRYKTHSKGEQMTKVDIDAIVKAMKTMQEKYAVIFKFTTKERCGEDIINILHTRYDEYNNYFQNKLKEIRSRNNAK